MAEKAMSTSTTTNTSISVWIPLATAIITAVITWTVARRAALNNTISTQRILWVNKLRDHFVDFNKLAYEYSSNKNTYEKNKEKPNFDFMEKHYELRALLDRINLLLNPNEEFSKRLSEKLLEIIMLLKDNKYNVKTYENLTKELNLIQQVILKAEWKRIKIEIKKGKELSDKKVAKIYTDKAKSMGLSSNNLVEER
ncbi:hypothetical protein [Bacillus subtilis]|uniref:hypothetical protein n=1 Tax=Bacillus subtilis TaxID=1423 RepID=UPI003EBBFFE4